MTTRTLTNRAKVLAALGVTSLALAGAAPANAIYRNYEPPSDDAPTTTRTVNSTNETTPVDENGKKSCEYAKFGGGTGYYPHGTTITVTLPSGGSKTVKCDDGEWVAAAMVQTGGYYFQADEAYVDASGALTFVNRHDGYTYSAPGGS